MVLMDGWAATQPNHPESYVNKPVLSTNYRLQRALDEPQRLHRGRVFAKRHPGRYCREQVVITQKFGTIAHVLTCPFATSGYCTEYVGTTYYNPPTMPQHLQLEVKPYNAEQHLWLVSNQQISMHLYVFCGVLDVRSH